VARLAARAQPAGDADPYRKPEPRIEGDDERDASEHESEFDGVDIDSEE
jgi:hypothetical protein